MKKALINIIRFATKELVPLVLIAQVVFGIVNVTYSSGMIAAPIEGLNEPLIEPEGAYILQTGEEVQSVFAAFPEDAVVGYVAFVSSTCPYCARLMGIMNDVNYPVVAVYMESAAGIEIPETNYPVIVNWPPQDFEALPCIVLVRNVGEWEVVDGGYGLPEGTDEEIAIMFNQMAEEIRSAID